MKIFGNLTFGGLLIPANIFPKPDFPIVPHREQNKQGKKKGK